MFALMNLMLLLGAAGVIMWTLACGVPLLARSTFVGRMSELHDSVADAVLSGQLSATDPAVVEFLGITDTMAKRPEEFGLSEAFAVHLAFQDLGEQPDPRPSYSALSGDERRFMHDSERALNRVLRPYLLFGSRFWWAFGTLLLARRVVYAVKGVPTAVKPDRSGTRFGSLGVNAEQLATDIRGEARRRLPDLQVRGPQLLRQ